MWSMHLKVSVQFEQFFVGVTNAEADHWLLTAALYFLCTFFLKLAMERSHKWWWNALWVTLRVFGQKMGQGRAFACSNEDLFRSGNTFVGTLMNFSCLGHCSDWWARTCRLHGQKRSSKSAAYFRWHGVIWLSRKHDVADGSRVAVVAATTRRQTTDPRCPNDFVKHDSWRFLHSKEIYDI